MYNKGKIIDVSINSEICLMLDNVISGMLPHENFNSDMISECISELVLTVLPDELYGFYYVIYTMFDNMKHFSTMRHTKSIELTKDIFDKSLKTEITSLILDSNFDSKRFFSEYGKSFNLEIPKEKENATDAAYSICIEKYDELFELKYKTENIFNEFSILKNELKKIYCIASVNAGAMVLTNGENERGEIKSGSDVYINYMESVFAAINERFSIIESKAENPTVKLNSYEDAEEFRSNNIVSLRYIYTSHISQIAENFSYRAQDIVTYVANEGVGKTTYIVGEVYDGLTQGQNVLFYTGETATIKISAMIESIHIFKMYGLRFSVDDLINTDNIVDTRAYTRDRLIEMINSARIDLYNNEKYGKLSLNQSFAYAHAMEAISNEFATRQYDIVVIDHTAAMDRTMDEAAYRLGLKDKRTCIDHLMYCEDKLVKKYNCMFINTSHTSNDSERDIAKGKDVGSRITGNSSDISKYSTHIWLIKTNIELEKNNRRVLEHNKVRDHAKILVPIVVDREIGVPYFTYNAEHQYMSDDANIDVDDLLG